MGSVKRPYVQPSSPESSRLLALACNRQKGSRLVAEWVGGWVGERDGWIGRRRDGWIGGQREKVRGVYGLDSLI